MTVVTIVKKVLCFEHIQIQKRDSKSCKPMWY
uniref:Uncharacterized protein n=1 Tax=Solanum lycopersicum TaxID=4081 RepID=K4CSC6_SOLLC